ncbi:MAG: DUF4388 domain-containing protein [Chloroflexota bacterium]
MTLVGDLKQVSLARVLQVVAAGRKTGVLHAKSGRTAVTLHLRRGRLQRAWLNDWPEQSAALADAQTPAEHNESLKTLAGESDLGVALWLDWCGFTGAEQSLALTRAKSTEALHTLATWRKGELQFEDGAGLGPGAIDINLAVAPLIDELRGSP